MKFWLKFIIVSMRSKGKENVKKSLGAFEKEQVEKSVYTFQTWLFSGTINAQTRDQEVRGG